MIARLLVSLPFVLLAAAPVIGLLLSAVGLGSTAADYPSDSLPEMFQHLARAAIVAILAAFVAQIIGLSAAFGLTYRPVPVRPVLKPFLALLAVAPVLVFSVPMLRGAWSLGLGENIVALTIVYVLVLAPLAAWIHTWTFAKLDVADLLAFARLDGVWLGRALRLVLLPRIAPSLWLALTLCLAVPWIQISSFGVLSSTGFENLARLYVTEGLTWTRSLASLAQTYVLITVPVILAVVLARRQLLDGIKLVAADQLSRWTPASRRST